MKNRALALLLALIFLLLPIKAAQAASNGILNGKCTLDWDNFCRYPSRLSDNNYKTGVDLKNGDAGAIYWTADVGVDIVYWEWMVPPEECRYTFYDENRLAISTSIRYREGDRGYLEVPEGAFGVSMEVISGNDGDLSRLTEWHVYSKENLPENIHLWEEAPKKCDIMLGVAHSDDELVMMGGIIPIYAGERGLRVQVVYCYVPEENRHSEALNGLWHSGQRTLPVIFHIPEKDLEKNRYRFEERITREIRRFQPEVVITHDIDGEYGNPGHVLVSRNCREACEAAADGSKFPESAQAYGTWQVKKVYVHLYDQNQIVMDFDSPLTAFGGKTAFELAQEAYTYHKSQRGDWLNQLKSNKYDCRKYGLYFTTVGEDVQKKDFLENIPAECISDYVAPAPTPTPEMTATPEPTAEPTAEPTPAPTDTPAPTAAPTDTPVPTATATAEPTAAPSPAPVGGSGVTVVLGVFVSLAVGLTAAIGVLLLRKKR